MNRGYGLKLSLLVSLGLVPIACGGAVRTGIDDGHGGTGPNETGGGGGTGGRGGPDNPPHGAGGGVIVSGGAYSGGTGSSFGVATSGGAALTGCTSPKIDPSSGLVTCAEGFQHRPKATFCEAVGGAPAEIGGAGGESSDGPKPRATGDVPCERDGDCQRFELGYCGGSDGLDPPTCQSGCLADNDCGPSALCVCNGYSGHGGECQPSNCRTDADCGPQSLCASYYGACGSNGFACLSGRDECWSTKECGGRGTCSYEFVSLGGGSNAGFYARVCNDAVCGRPFLVDDEARVAPVQHRGDWCSRQQLCPETAHLSDTERASLAQHWTRMGQMEHASIAAFARFSLQLLGLGAPPELVEACTRALQDETEHAQLCFALASAYAGHAIGPAALDLSNSLAPTTLAEIVELVISEGCFGETSAALDALDAADTASDPVIGAAYSRIARDEQRHAELAFRFVRWALQQEPGIARSVRAAIVAERPVSATVQDVVETCLYGILARRAAA